MLDRTAKWLIYTVLVGLIPVGGRLLVWAISQDRSQIQIINAADFVVFGLILLISNINEVQHIPDNRATWKTFQNGASIVSIIWLGGLYIAYLIEQSNTGLINTVMVLYMAIGISILAFFNRLAVFARGFVVKS